MAVFHKPIKALAAKRRYPFVANGLWPSIDHRLIDKVGIKKGLRHRRASFDKHAHHAVMSEYLKRFPNIKHAAILDWDGKDLRATIEQTL